ncbi:Ig-like domain-containing protein [Halomonas sp. 18071143]|uniref:Ig-like domain-containing protein n=1 Tax=Halomonas sp. 18071143 TaxID=2855441 RepID=UPI00210BADAE|nr:Ig-like domain-containing protein [Halomonas sp. 18071143]
MTASFTDSAGSLSSDTTTPLLDTTAPDAPVISLDNDTGADASDGITKDGAFTVSGVEDGALVEYSTDGGNTWSTDKPTAVEGENTISVRQTDAAGNVSDSSSLTFTLDTTAPDAPVISLDNDTGADASDGITKDGAFTVSGVEDGALVEYSTDGGNTWSIDKPTAVEGENTISVRQTDAAGNVSDSSDLTFTLDTTAPDAPVISLDNDTGADASDGITKDGAFTVSGVEDGALVEYSTDGGNTWSTDKPTAVEGENTISVRQTDAAGNVSDSSSLTFTLDTTAPDAPVISLDNDTGADASDGITKDGAFTVSGVEDGALVEYSTDGGNTWSIDKPTAVEGENTISVRQTDAAGNVSDSSDLTFTLDTTAPDAPVISLDNDTGADASDGITKDGAFTVSGVEDGALVEYSTDGGNTWSIDKPTAVEGENTISVRQTDAAGNVSDSSSLTFTLDTTAPDAPVISLDNDTGADASDGITKDGAFTVSGVEDGALVEYSTDGGNTWSTDKPTAVEGENTISVRQTDAAGNVSDSSDLTFTLDTTAPDAPVISLDNDTGADASDGITKDGAFTVSGVEDGALVEYSTDGGNTWSTDKPTAVEGENTISVRQTDAAGNVSDSSSLTFTLDTTAPDAPVISLDNDTGADASDGITKDGAFTVSGVEDGALVEYSTDGGNTWSIDKPTAVEGENTISVRQTDAAGNVSDSSSLTFTLDTTAPDAPVISLDNDTGADASDGITKDGAFTVSGVEDGALVEYSTDGGNTWSIDKPTAVEGENTISVRQTDAAGNVSDSSSLTFTLDTTAPDAPVISLDNDTGADASDGITKDGAFTVSGVEDGALVEYSTDGGNTWSIDKPTAVEGENTISVRQTDAAGNVSDSSSLTFTLDTTAPDAPVISLDNDTGADASDGITKDGAFTVSGVEDGALVEYSTDGGNTWSIDKPTAVEGENTISVRQTDAAGNVSDSSSLTFTLDTTAPDAPVISLDNDTGADASDGITKDGAFTVSGVEDGALVEYSTDGGNTWSIDKPTAVEGENTISVRQTDAAGNVSDSSDLTFTLDTTAPDAPVISLDNDTGADASDGITKDGAFTVSGVEDGALVEYSTDGGNTWSTDKPTAVEGENTISVRQTDAAGNVSDSSSLTFTLDTTAPDAPVISLDNDTGADASDGITKDGAFTVSGVEDGALVEYSTDGGNTWSTDKPTAVEGENTISVRQTDAAGNVSDSSSLTFTLDTTAPDAPVISLDNDTGADASDGITKDGAFTVSGVEDGALVEYSTDGGNTWSTDKPTAVEGENTISVRQTDAAGNVSDSSSLTFTLDTTAPDAPVISLDNDTGADASDGITKDGAFTVSGVEDGALVEYSTDGGNTWSIDKPTAVEGENTISVRQTDAAGNVSDSSDLTFTLDTTAPDAPVISLDNDTGADASDGITKDGAFTVSGVEDGALVEYSTDGGNTWSTDKPTAVEGENTISVRQTDAAGNVSDSSSLTFTLDTTAPDAPVISLDNDTGADASDGITKDGAFTVSGVEDGALVEYSTDGGNTWSTDKPTAVEGENTISVRQTDAAGNVSDSSSLTFTLDTTAPDAPVISLDNDTGADASDGITKDGAFTVSGVEDGALVEYSTDGGNTWSIDKPTAVEGENTISVRQTDAAGNVSDSSSLTFTLDTTAPDAPVISLDNDTGADASDGITKDGAFTVSGVEDGALVEYSTDGGNTWSTDKPTAVEGENTISVRQTDAAGNVSDSSSLTFTLDTTAPDAPVISLDNDTGADASDGITKDGAFTVSGVEDGALVEYSTDGGNTWSIDKPTAVEGENTISVRQTDAAGNVSDSSSLTFTLDTTAPDAPVISLDNDTGADASDGITKDGAFTVSGVEDGALVEYSTDGGNTWSIDKPTAVEGENTISVRQTDAAGNVSDSSSLTFTLDTTAPDAPVISLDNDTGADASDGITKDGAFTVSGVEDGALVEYSTDGGNTWSIDKPTAVEGENTISVRQTDAAGNVSDSSSLTFTLDTTAPDAPVISLDNDTGADASDGITKDGAFTVSGVEDGALVEYSTDGGNTWSTDKPTAVEGENTISVRQTDAAGNVSDSSSLTFTLDTTAPDAPVISLDNDTGADASDGITKDGAFTVSGVEDGALVEYSTDGGNTWSIDKPTAVEGENTISVRQTDAAGNVSDSSDLTFTLDTTAPDAPVISLDNDTGADASDGITKDGAFTVSGVEDGALVEYSTDGGNTWSTDKPTAVEGENTISVRQTDAAGNVSDSSSLTFTLDTTAPDAPVISLDNDTGADASDGITKDGAFTVSGVEDGALVEYSTDGGNTWSIDKPTAVEGENTISVRQTDAAGNVSDSSSLTFTLDTTAPDAPVISLDNDTGADASDGITKDGAFTVSGVEDGALVEYSTDGGNTWSIDKPTAVEGENTISVRQTDAAGNVSDSSSLTFTLDTTAPDAPVISLDNDTGADASDGITKDGAFTVSGVEDGALVEYSTDGGNTWSTDKPTAVEGENTISVRQTDAAGNVSDSSSLTFTLDTTAPDAPVISLDNDTGADASDGITKDGAFTVSGVEDGALVEYSTDGGNTWSIDKPTAVEGENTISVRQTDAAGNVSDSSSLTFTLDTTAPDAPVISLDNDTGADASDGITKDGAFTVSGVEDGALVEYSTDGGNTWSTDKPTAVEGENTISVRQTDAAGNVSDSSSLTFTLDTTAPDAPVISLDNDTGADASDGITKDGAFTVSGVEDGALVEYSTDGGNTWSTDKPTAVEGENTISVRQTDAAGNVSDSSSLTFTLDTTAPDAPVISLDNDTGADASDGITKDGAFTVSGVEDGALVEYSTDGGNTWSTDKPTAVEGENTISVRQTDAAGNVSDSSDLTFTLDTTAPDAPVISLDNDTGADASDGITKDGAFTVSGVEDGALVEYSTDGGNTWSIDKPTAVEGENTISVRQTDAAGNVSDSSSLTFTLDTTAPDAPVISLDNDTGADASDGITKDGAFTVSGVEDGALVEYSTDGGNTWSIDKPTAVEGENTISVRQTDAAGNVSDSSSLTFTLDTTAPDAPVISLDNDTGADASDGITKDGAFTVSGVEDGALVEYSTDGGNTWSIDKPTAVEGENTISVRQTDAAGNVSDSSSLTFTLDTTAPDAPVISLDNDTGADASDGITKDGAFTVSGVEDGALVEYSTDGGNTWSIDKPTAVEGENTISVRQTDAAGNVSDSSSLTFTLDTTAPDAPVISLDNDTGADASDGITKDGAFTVSGVEDGALVEYSTDGGNTWSIDKPTAVEGENTISVRQTDAAGNVSDSSDLTFTLDTTAPDAPVISLDNDTGADASDGITKDGAFTVSGVEDGALVEYSTDGGNTWSIDKPTAVEGENTISVRQTDAAGNVSDSSSLTFTLDTTAPDAPVISLDNDTGADASDGITKDGAFTVSGVEDGALVEYSTDGGNTWSIDKPTAVEGENTISVRQTDAAGNVSDSSSLTFTLDTTAPDAPVISLDNDTGADASDGITKDGAFTVSGVEDGALVEYSTDGGNTWSTDKPTAVEGENTISVRQTDAAGNVSDSSSLTFTLDTTAPDAPVISLDNDTGADASDGITKDGAFTVSGVEDGALVEYSTDGGNTWSIDKPTAVEGENTISVRQTDAAGNVSDSSSLTFTLDTTAPTLTVDAPNSNDTTPTITGTSDEIGATVTVVVTDANGVEQTLTAEVQQDGSWSVDVTTPLAEGDYEVEASVSDAVGNEQTASDTGEIDVTAPTLTVDAPNSNDTTPTITGTSDEIGATVTVVVTDANGVEQTLTAEVQPDGSWSVDVTTPLAEGDYEVEASVSDAVGNEQTASDTGEIDVTAPTLTVDAPNSNDTTPTITGTSDEIGATVTVVVTDANGVEQTLTAEVQPDGTWSVEVENALPEGGYTVEASVSDAVGNTTTATDSGAIDLTPLIIAEDDFATAQLNILPAEGGTISESDSQKVLVKLGPIGLGTRSPEVYFTIPEGQTGDATVTVTNNAVVGVFDDAYAIVQKLDPETGEYETVTTIGSQGLIGFVFLFGEGAQVELSGLEAGDYRIVGGSSSALAVGSITTVKVEVDLLDTTSTVEADLVSGNVLINDIPGSTDTVLKVWNGSEFEMVTDSGIKVMGEYGEFELFADGTYTYLPDANLDNVGEIDSLTYQLVHPTGVTAEATLHVGITGPGVDSFVWGSEGDDTLQGDDYNDVIYNDVIYGGEGNDILTGGAGADTFKWEFGDQGTSGSGAAVDKVTDFTLGEFGANASADRLDLADLLQNENADTIDQYIMAVQQGGDTVLHIKSDGGIATDGSNADQQIVLKNVQMSPESTSSDFIQSLLENGQLKIDL